MRTGWPHQTGGGCPVNLSTRISLPARRRRATRLLHARRLLGHQRRRHLADRARDRVFVPALVFVRTPVLTRISRSIFLCRATLRSIARGAANHAFARLIPRGSFLKSLRAPIFCLIPDTPSVPTSGRFVTGCRIATGDPYESEYRVVLSAFSVGNRFIRLCPNDRRLRR
jgi:hypothetical protein